MVSRIQREDYRPQPIAAAASAATTAARAAQIVPPAKYPVAGPSGQEAIARARAQTEIAVHALELLSEMVAKLAEQKQSVNLTSPLSGLEVA